MRFLVAALILGAGACAPAPEDLERRQESVLNGADDRLEVFQAPAALRGPLLASTAALIYAHRLVERAPADVALRAPTAGAALRLCADEPFAGEPSAAFCSGVLIDDDLVATAAHCLGDDTESAERRCRQLRIVFGYALLAADRPAEARADLVFACRRVVALENDLAVLVLDRTAGASLAARPLAEAGARTGDALVVASHGAGLPLKIEQAAAVTATEAQSGALTVAMDTFGGSSGGGLFTQDLALVGLVSGGDVDWEIAGGCARAARSAVPRERGAPAARLAGAVCDAGWPSARLCGRQAACGDGVCGTGEAPGCPGDCPAPRCGDSLCEPAERGACREDCARYQGVPPSWASEPDRFVPATIGDPPSGCSVSAHAPSAPLVLLALAGSVTRSRRRRREPSKQTL